MKCFVSLTLSLLLTDLAPAQTLSANDPYRLWAESKWGTAIVSDSAKKATVWGETADPDKDTVPNLVEYALGTDPKISTPSPRPTVQMDGGKPSAFLFSIVRRTDDPALIVVPQISSDLSWWSPEIPADTFTWSGDQQFFYKIPPASGAISTVLPPFTEETFIHPIASYEANACFARLTVKRSGATASTALFDDLRLPETVTGTPGSTVESTSIVPTGFAGTITLSVNGGAHLIVDGVDLGSSAAVSANSRVFLRAATPLQADFQYSYTLNFGGLYSTIWNAISRAQWSPTAVAGTPSGYTPVNASVNESGAAEISIPITVPPGTAGMEPKLAIGYSSQGGNGMLGVGFSLSGLSQISRTGATQFHDGFKGGVNFDSKDRYLLDGQRLILVAGTWGAANSEYRTEMESFSRIRLLPNSSGALLYWEVQTKAGLTIRLGDSNDSRSFAQRFSGDTAILSWSSASITDTNGNQILFDYATPSGLEIGHKRIESITYATNTTTSPPLAAASQVFFEYENRDDDPSSWVGGAQISVRMRLSAIECRHAGSAARRYELAYQYSADTQASQLTEIVEKLRSPSGGPMQSLPPTTFAWQTNGGTVQFGDPLRTTIKNWGATNVDDIVGDFSGDGVTDVLVFNTTREQFDLYVNNGVGSFSSPIETPVRGKNTAYAGARTRNFIGDFDADGFMDVATMEPDTSSYSFHFGGIGGLSDAIITTITPIDTPNHPTITGDFNGDGRTDFLAWVRVASIDPDPAYYPYFSNGRSFTRKSPGLPSWDNATLFPQQIAADFNGDGMSDVLLWHVPGATSRYNLLVSNGDGTFQPAVNTDIDSWDNPAVQNIPGDFNGDGLMDLMVWHKPLENNRFNLYTNTGRNGKFILTATNVRTDDQPNVLRQASSDFNGDGLMDMFMWEGSIDRHYIYSSNGKQGFNAAKDSGVPSDTDPRRLSQLGDFNGDGRSDVLVWDKPFDNNRYNLYLSNGPQPDLVASVKNGHGGSTTFSYKPLTDKAVFTRGSGSLYPCYDLQASMHVVSSISTSNGTFAQFSPGGGDSNFPLSTTISYTYEKAWMCLDGRGFRGFQAIEAQNEETGIRSRTESIGTDPVLAGHPTRQVTMLANGRKIQETITQWTYKTFNFTNAGKTDSSYFPYANRTTEMEYDISRPSQEPPFKTTIHRGVTYDNYGNLTNSTTEWDGGFLEVTDSVYYPPDLTKWWLGRLSVTTVTQIQPNGTGGTTSATRRSRFDYSPTNGQVVQEVIDTTDAAEKLWKTYEHDGYGNIKKSVLEDIGTGEKRTTLTRYSADGRFVTETENDFGHIEHQTHDPLTGNVLTRTGPNGLTSIVEYDFLGRPLREHRPDGTESLTQYLRYTSSATLPKATTHGVLTQTAGASWKAAYFDVVDREIHSSTPHYNGQILHARKVFNERGEVTKAHLPYFGNTPGIYTEFQYDEISRQKKDIAPGNRQTSTAYSGLTATVTNPVSQQFSTSADVRGRTASSTAFGSQTVTNSHDPYGNLLKVDDNRGHLTSMAYNVRGFKTSMTEPNSGTTSYKYNAFGELKEQTDALGRKTTLKYDKLGRLIERTEPEGTTVWTYDTAANGIGKLARLYRVTDGYEETYRYDSLGRPVETAYHIGNAHFVTGTTYDEYGRPLVVTYPTGFAIRNDYTADGFLRSVKDAFTGAVFWTAIAYNDRGQLTEEDFGNFISSQRAYDPETGFLQSILTGNRTGGPGSVINSHVQTLSYEFNDIGNLTRRKNDNLDDTSGNRGIWENFTYDTANRLTNIASNGHAAEVIGYNSMGNITSKTGVGGYTYSGINAGPHAVTSITGSTTGQNRTLTYDAAGNCIRNGDTTITYTSSNQPATLTKGTTTLHFSYSPGRARYRQVERLGTAERTKLYIGGLYEKETDSAGNTTHTHFIPGGSGVVAIHTISQPSTGAATTKTRYVHKDHLGSIHALTREDGSIDELLYFDAWGRRQTWNATTHAFTTATVTSQTDRGFTGHEMLDALGLVHMNGRLYDPILGRFMSVDPIVQEAGNLQNLNRYSYVLNNPLSLTDPSGFYAESRRPPINNPRIDNRIRYSPNLPDMWRGINDGGPIQFRPITPIRPIGGPALGGTNLSPGQSNHAILAGNDSNTGSSEVNSGRPNLGNLTPKQKPWELNSGTSIHRQEVDRPYANSTLQELADASPRYEKFANGAATATGEYPFGEKLLSYAEDGKKITGGMGLAVDSTIASIRANDFLLMQQGYYPAVEGVDVELGMKKVGKFIEVADLAVNVAAFANQPDMKNGVDVIISAASTGLGGVGQALEIPYTVMTETKIGPYIVGWTFYSWNHLAGDGSMTRASTNSLINETHSRIDLIGAGR